MGIYTIGANSDRIGIQGANAVILSGNCRQFGGSNKGEVAGIEKEQQPAALEVIQTYFDLFPTVIGRSAKVRRVFFQAETVSPGNNSVFCIRHRANLLFLSAISYEDRQSGVTLEAYLPP